MKKINFNDLCSALRGRRLPLYALITAAAIVLLAVSAVMLPRLTHTNEEIPEGTLRNPTTTPLSEDDPAITPVDFVPSDSDFCLSLPDSTAGTVYAVPTDSALYLTSSRTVTAESLADTLVITPAAPLSVTASGEGFLVTPMSGAWNADTLYRLSLDGEEGYLAAFQTARIFAVDTVYPAHQSTDVPTDTGIEITFSDTAKVFFKELLTALLCGLALAVVCFGKIWLVDRMLFGNTNITLTVDLVVCLALCVTVVIAKAVGCLLPIAAKAIHVDPAVMASPFITTIVDALSLLVYFLFAKMILPI